MTCSSHIPKIERIWQNIDYSDDHSMPQPLPNLHHLELFYHVAKSGGITAATRSMPYGIQQPAVSGQLSVLEGELGVRLFQRRPFELTPAGRELYEFVGSFFSKLPEVAERIAGKASRHLRLAAPAMLIREHLPQVIAEVRKRQPALELTLVEAGQRRVIDLLEREEIDLAVADLEGKPPSGIKGDVLISLPLVLLVPDVWHVGKPRLEDLCMTRPLIRLESETSMSRLFAKGLTKRKLSWPAAIEVSTLELVHAYVAQGFGVGLTLQVPRVKFPKGVKALPLEDFPPLVIMAMWRGPLHPLAEEVLAGLKKLARLG